MTALRVDIGVFSNNLMSFSNSPEGFPKGAEHLLNCYAFTTLSNSFQIISEDCESQVT